MFFSQKGVRNMSLLHWLGRRNRYGYPYWSIPVGMLTLLVALTFITRDLRWNVFWAFSAVPEWARRQYDERYVMNIARAGRNGFFLLMALLLVLNFYVFDLQSVDRETILMWLLGAVYGALIVFHGSLWWYERRGA